ncbi:C-terminal helicase domain-containing protein [Erysipelothrix sp. HDW6A]|uniref:helicase-related protein n=1 Tax=Erysipelothrix sp. HDW6A TaxID=2714928 RepID=UPI001F0D9DCF|nr:C-terminal helicase domain-containing protein [Erysipelothrix sp. HDW6A]
MTNGEPVLVFTRTKRGADRVVRELKKRKIDAVAIHGDKSQMARQKALENFKEYRTQILVATDIASRGIDISELPYVINFDMPEVPETYVHRIGRTGRAGNTGRAISYVNYQEIHLLKDIEKLIKMKLTVVENERYPLEDKTEKKKKQVRKRNDSKPSKSQEVSKAKGSRPNKAKRSSDKRSRPGKEESSKRGERSFSKTQRNTNGRNRKRHGSKTKK